MVKITRKKIVVIVAIFIGLLLLWWILSMSPVRPHTASQSVQSQATYGYVNGKNMYNYNGLAFFKTDTTTGAITPLLSGIKLPTASQVVWANDKGALMSFSAAFSSTVVAQKLSASGYDIYQETPALLVWYVDFTTKDVYRVSDVPILGELATYSPTKNGFYFITNNKDVRLTDDQYYDAEDAYTPLFFFDIATKKTSVVDQNLKLSGLSYIHECKTDSLCFVNTETDTGNKLYEYRDSKLTSILGSSGRLLPTNNKDIYLTADLPQGEKTSGEDVDLPDMDVYAHDITSGTKKALSAKIANEDISAYFYSPDEFYMLTTDTKNEASLTDMNIGSKTLLGLTKITHQPQDLLKKNLLLAPYSYGDNGLTLGHSLEGGDVVVSSTQLRLPSMATSSSAETVIQRCAITQSFTYQYDPAHTMFKIFMPEDKVANLSKFTDCVLKSDALTVLPGYAYYFGTTDPVSGKITSD